MDLPFSRANPRNYKYLDFTDGTKPYLLNRIDHGTGKITEIRYRSSAGYAREAEAGGNRWKTSLPFPLQVVSEVIESDKVAHRSGIVDSYIAMATSMETNADSSVLGKLKPLTWATRPSPPYAR